MASKKLRRIVVDGEVYLWNYITAHRRVCTTRGNGRRDDTFKAYAEGNRTSPLQKLFAPLGDQSRNEINLYTPKGATILIRAGLKRGWKANAKSAPLTIENGVDLLAELSYKAD